MATITIENVPESVVKKHFKTTFSYDEVNFDTKKYIDTKEYKDDDYEIFDDMESLVADLQKYKK